MNNEIHNIFCKIFDDLQEITRPEVTPMHWRLCINTNTSREHLYMSLVVRKPAFCICENKDAGQLRCNREADQRLCFRYIDSTIPLLSKYEMSCL